MAENEIVKHVEAAYKALNNRKTNWLHKCREVLVEIAIIVFAVTISIWFHNWSDSIHEHKEEREYLVGLKADLSYDIQSAQNDRKFYDLTWERLRYFMRVGAGEPLNADSLTAYRGVFFSNATLEPHVSRYEGLKGSGKFGIIQNKDLLNKIISLHEQTIKHVEYLDTYYADFANRLGYFLQEHGTLSADYSVVNAQEVLRMNQMRFLLLFGFSTIPNNMLIAHDSCISQCRQIIRQIDQELARD